MSKKQTLRTWEESIKYNMEALELRRGPHPDMSSSLNNLASAILAQFEQKEDFENLADAAGVPQTPQGGIRAETSTSP
ncbi:hypothetical protein BDP27DRAFT_1503906 [Rhodocollybia butyracea]|uniref:Uncharacterized protein n=1 Tax=Rhodocollybia butyracea TaxID=206335 RepID=A0A9P5TY59_9AGAR|nr:hypothetical protein BDP27DRAFT_1503906 [Rhodocollybia butyracea]